MARINVCEIMRLCQILHIGDHYIYLFLIDRVCGCRRSDEVGDLHLSKLYTASCMVKRTEREEKEERREGQ